MIWIINIVMVFALCVFFAGIVIPQILLIAFRRRLFVILNGTESAGGRYTATATVMAIATATDMAHIMVQRGRNNYLSKKNAHSFGGSNYSSYLCGGK